jgi:hypothetical protein
VICEAAVDRSGHGLRCSDTHLSHRVGGDGHHFRSIAVKTYIEWAKRHPWGRELNGIFMTSCALIPALIAFWIAR